MKEALGADNASHAIRHLQQFTQSLDSSNTDEAVKSIVPEIIAAYRDLHFTAVHQLYQQIDNELPEAVAKSLHKHLDPQIQETMKWVRQLQSISNERRASSLRVMVRNKDYERANALVKKMMEQLKTEEASVKMAKYIGQVLATLINDQEKADQFIQKMSALPDQCGMTQQRILELKESMNERSSTIYSEGVDNIERMFRTNLINLVNEMRNKLPGQMVTADKINEQHIETFRVVTRALFGAAVASKDPTRWLDLVSVFTELCPQNLSSSGAQSGVEQRLYMAVTPVEQRVIDKCLFEIGEIKHAGSKFLSVAKAVDQKDVRMQVNIVEIMGMLRSDRFISHILNKLKTVKECQAVSILALGNIGSPTAGDELIDLLKKVFKSGVKRGQLMEGPHRRAAKSILNAISKIAASRRTNTEQRNDLLNQIRPILPSSDSRLILEAAIDFFKVSGSDWEPQNLQWAVQTLSNGLWLLDNSPTFQGGGEKDSIIGFREPLTQALIRLVPKNPQLFIDSIQDHLTHPGAAFIACGTVARETKLTQLAGTIEQMIITTMKTPEGTRYGQETYFDSATKTRKSLTRDQIISELIFALSEMKVPESENSMARLFDIFKSGRLENPGEESMKVLFDARQKARIAEGEKSDDEQPEDEAKEEIPFESYDMPAQTQQPSLKQKLSQSEIKGLIKSIKPGMFMMGSGKKAKIIAAIATIGENFVVEAIDGLLDLCLHKDMVLAGAAKQAIMRFGDVDAPKHVSNSLCMSLIERVEAETIDVSENARDMLVELRPDREPFKSQISSIIQSEGNSRLGRILLDVMSRSKYGAKGGGPQMATVPDSDANSEDGEKKEAEIPPNQAYSNKMELKRQYLQARKAWIAGGKNGPPPEPPPGM